MSESIQKSLSVPRMPALAVLSTLSVIAFGWLLVSDSIQPIAVFLLQLYLTF